MRCWFLTSLLVLCSTRVASVDISPSPPRLQAGSDNWRVFRTVQHGSLCMEWSTSQVLMRQCDNAQANTKQRWYATSSMPTQSSPMNIISAHDGRCLTVDGSSSDIVMAECGTGDATKQQYYYTVKNQIKFVYDGFGTEGKQCVQYATSDNTVSAMICKDDGESGVAKQQWLSISRPPAPPPPPLQPPPAAPAFTPLGAIVGTGQNSYFGDSVALSADGTVLAVGALKYDNERGMVRVYVRTQSTGGETSWTQRGDDLKGVQMNIQFGDAVALSSDGIVLAVGASRYTHDGKSQAGGVWVYTWQADTSSWEQRGSALLSSAASAFFGSSVDLSDDGAVLAAGGRQDSQWRGVVRVFVWASGAWSQRGADLTGSSSQANFGTRVRLSSDGLTLAVGAHKESSATGTDSAGAVRAYTWNPTSERHVTKGSAIYGATSNDRLGSGLALSSDGTVLAAGAPGYGGWMKGRVRVYEWASAAGASVAWVQRGGDLDGGGNGDEFGWSVALSSDGARLVVGARKADGGATDTGSASLFTYAAGATPAQGAWSRLMSDVYGEVRVCCSGARSLTKPLTIAPPLPRLSRLTPARLGRITMVAASAPPWTCRRGER